LSLSRRGRNKDDGTSLKLTDLGITVKSISKATKKRIRLSTVAAARSAVVDIMDSAKEGEEAGGLAWKFIRGCWRLEMPTVDWAPCPNWMMVKWVMMQRMRRVVISLTVSVKRRRMH
jgi:hypothetical protein